MSRQTRKFSTFTKIALNLASFAFFTLISLFPIVPKAMASLGKCDPSQSNFTLSDCYFLDSSKQTPTTVADIYDKPAVLVKLLTRNIFIVAGLIEFFLIIYTGYLFISGGTKGQEQAKDMMSNAVAGFAIMFAAYWIIQIVQIITGVNFGF